MNRVKYKIVGVFTAVFALAGALRAANQFGDIFVDPNAIYTGNTYHGYAEMRVNLENQSYSRSHIVTLVYPNNSEPEFGNNITRLSRTVTLAPGATEVVSLLQPPLQASGDGTIRVEVDSQPEGQIHAPNANSHCNFNSRGNPSTTIFISRNVDYDTVERLFHANRTGFTAAMATGPPDTTSGGYETTAWMPDTRRYGTTNWLELDYATPQVVTNVIVYSTQGPITSGFLELIGASGKPIVKQPMNAGRTSGGYSSGGHVSPSGGYMGSSSLSCTISFGIASNNTPIKTLRLNFGSTPPHAIGIDAVQISGPSGSQWAAEARASSDNSAMASSYSSGPSSDPVQTLRAESPVSEWSPDWLAYSPFDAVILNQADLSSMSSAVQGAIGDYLAAGGVVILSGNADLPPSWHPSQTTKLKDGVEYEVGFGQCFSFIPEVSAMLNSDSITVLRNTVRDTAHYWQGLPDDFNSANAEMPVVKNLKIPTRGIVIIMLVFIIVIGPVNIILLNRLNRRTWMLWTIPVISFLTTLLVFAYSILREGVTPNALISGLTVLDQVSHRAVTIGATAFYCPLTPSGGLHFDFETEVTPLLNRDYQRDGLAGEVDWTQSQHFSRGWVSARVPAYFHLRRSDVRRERVQVVDENGTREIVNSLGAPIKSLWFADANMHVYKAGNIPAGEKGGLISAADLPASQSEKKGACGLLREIGFAARTDSLDVDAEQFLLPNSYIAVLDGNPFLENALV